ncbi:MAG: xanthine dehydrogenase family protein molybdopterin-binding subunit [Betaproteobacteria bacterium]|nr:xanthine dehydrogenase family protein molybdopterin-binding subunit [Betaproteobacteria bacterium]
MADHLLDMAPETASRRAFLKTSALAGGGLVLGLMLPTASRVAQAAAAAPMFNPLAEPGAFSPNAYVRVGSDDQVTLVVDKSEMGQGVMTALPMLLAEEMDADWPRVRLLQAGAHEAYKNTLLGMQATGGSTSVRSSWLPLRRAGATARAMLVQAAAQRWQVDAAACSVEAGVVRGPGGRQARFGELAEDAARLPVPGEVRLKDPKDFRLLGRPLARVDVPEKTTGQAVFGLDMQIPGMLVASVAQPPAFGATVRGFDDAAARAIPGVHSVHRTSDGVAVLAQDFWTARKGRDALKIDWNPGPNAALDDAGIMALFRKAGEQPGALAWKVGEGEAALAPAAAAPGAKALRAEYALPFLAHATMEPMNCTAFVQKDRVDIWGPTQAQTMNQLVAGKIAGLPPHAVHVHTTLLGGGFGRRFEQDFVAQAVELSKASGKPVKVVWTREDDTRHDFYRPANLHRLHAVLDRDGRLQAWTHQIVGPSIFSRVFPQYVKDGIDDTSVQGAVKLPYAMPNAQTRYVLCNTPVPVGFWRSVGHSITAFTVESFIDELAHAAGADPYRFRRELLVHGDQRALATLDVAAREAGWGKALPAGHFHGIAMHESFGSYVTEVAEVSVDAQGQVRVHRVTCAVDCGQVVNPDIVTAQIQSAVVYGLTAALYDRIDLHAGGVVQGNFDKYRMLRMDSAPRVDVHILPSAEAPGGLGEPGTPPIAPAVANAVFAATGKRLRELPLRPELLKT